ncbi:MAG: hypothetical protein ACI97A_001908 [Planctomycetota bacterium]|jgi:hypothetical protein
MKSFSLLIVLMLATATHAQTTRFLQTVDFHSVSAASISGVGDVNSDGIPDYAVAVQRSLDSNSSATGAVQVFSGADGSQLFFLQSVNPADSFGSSVCGAGDANGDGFDDILVGAIGANVTHQDAGAAMLFSGRDGTLLHTVNGSSPSALAGSACVGMGDVNGDGHDDFAVGEPSVSGNGKVRVFSGRDASVLMSISGQGHTGASLANAGDVNGDGINDLAVGQPSHVVKTAGNPRGRVQVLSGANGSVLLSMAGDTDFSESGHSLASVGDITGDGVSDLAIAEPFRVDPRLGTMGRIKIVSGANGVTIRSLHSSSTTMSLGLQMSAVGDMDGDGFPDLAALQALPNDFEAHVFSGSTGNVLKVFPAHRFGVNGSLSVSGLGDINGDGAADLATVSVRENAAQVPETNTQVRVYETGKEPVKAYTAKANATPPLNLMWTPSHGNIYDTTGRLECSGMSANASAIVLASLAPTDMAAYGNHLLVDVSPMNLITVMDVLAPRAGNLRLPTISRRSPGMAGLKTYVQFWEVAPAVRSSNGLRFILVP